MNCVRERNEFRVNLFHMSQARAQAHVYDGQPLEPDALEQFTSHFYDVSFA